MIRLVLRVSERRKTQTKKRPSKKPKGGAEIRAAVITVAERLVRDRGPANVVPGRGRALAPELIA